MPVPGDGANSGGVDAATSLGPRMPLNPKALTLKPKTPNLSEASSESGSTCSSSSRVYEEPQKSAELLLVLRQNRMHFVLLQFFLVAQGVADVTYRPVWINVPGAG